MRSGRRVASFTVDYRADETVPRPVSSRAISKVLCRNMHFSLDGKALAVTVGQRWSPPPPFSVERHERHFSAEPAGARETDCVPGHIGLEVRRETGKE